MRDPLADVVHHVSAEETGGAEHRRRDAAVGFARCGGGERRGEKHETSGRERRCPRLASAFVAGRSTRRRARAPDGGAAAGALCWNVTGGGRVSRDLRESRGGEVGAVSARPGRPRDGEAERCARRRKFGARAHLVEVKGLAQGLHRRGGGPAGHRPLKLPGGQHRRAGRCARPARRARRENTPSRRRMATSLSETVIGRRSGPSTLLLPNISLLGTISEKASRPL